MSFYVSLGLTEGRNNIADKLKVDLIPTPTPKNTAIPIPTNSPALSLTLTPPYTATKTTFTWVSHVVNSTVAQKLYQMHFTDVAVRYVTEQEVVISQENLA